MEPAVNDVATYVVAFVATYGMNVLGAVVILVVGWSAAGWAASFTGKALGRLERIDLTLRRFFQSGVRYLVLVLTGLAVLSQFGVQTASLVTVLGAAGLAVGLALQGTLSNVAAGVMLLLLRPFKIGDFVEVAGHAGTVGAITLFATELATADNVHIMVPNAQVWGASVKNFSHHPTRRVEIVVGIAYEDDIDRAMATIGEIVGADARVRQEPAPLIAVSELADSSVNIVVRVWCNAGDFWPLKFQLTKDFKQGLDRAGITIPYPQRTVHMAKAEAA